MSFTLFDYNTLTTIAAFSGLDNAGYVLFASNIGNKTYYKAYNKSFADDPYELVTALSVSKKAISFYTNPYRREIAFAYSDFDHNIYLCTFEEDSTTGSLILKETDALIISGGDSPIVVYDAFVDSYLIYYVKQSDTYLYQALFKPYDTFVAEILIDEEAQTDTEVIMGSDFIRIGYTAARKVSGDSYFSLYSLAYDNSRNLSKRE